jgi:hypothetical protein
MRNGSRSPRDRSIRFSASALRSLFPSLCSPRDCGPCSLCSSRTILRCLRSAARTSDARPGLRRLLAVDSSADAAALRPVRRSVALVASDQRAARAMSPMPARRSPDRSRACGRRIRRRVARHRPRIEIRRAAIARASARRADASPRRRDAGGRGLGGPCAAASITTARSRIQSGRRPRPMAS